jgi:hypothetical protein
VKLPGFKRLYSKDFEQDDQSLVDKLSGVLNTGIESLYQALNKRVSLVDNIDCIVKDVTIKVDANGLPTSTTIFSLDDKTRNIQGLHVINAENLTNSNTYPSGGVFVSWIQVNTGIQILHVTGLQASQSYTLKIVAFY